MLRWALLLACVHVLAAGFAADSQRPSGLHHGGSVRRLLQAARAGSSRPNHGVMSAAKWPVPRGYLPLYRCIFRMVGRGMVQQRAALETGWRTFVQQEITNNRPGACTIRFVRYTEHPAIATGLQQLEAVDEEAVVYIRAANETAQAQLTFKALVRSLPTQKAYGGQAGVYATTLALTARADPAPEIVKAQLAAGDTAQSSPPSGFSVACHSVIRITSTGGQPLLTSVAAQTSFLLGFAEAAAQAGLPVDILAANISAWRRSATDSARGASAELASGIAEVWYQYVGSASAASPAVVWPAVTPLLPAATAQHGYRLSLLSLLQSSTSQVAANGTVVIISSQAAPAPVATSNVQRRPAFSMTTIGVAVALTVVALAVLTALLVARWAHLRRQRQRRLRDSSAHQKAEAWPWEDARAAAGLKTLNPDAQRLFIEDGADGCWVDFFTDAAGRRQPIGRGASSEVYLGQRESGGQKVALKVLSAAATAQPATLARLRREVALMRHVSRDANVVQFYGASLQHAADAVLVMEFCAGGNLRRLLSDPVLGPPLLWRHRGRAVALDAARGLAYLHSCDVVHRDIKSSNILLDGSGRAKVADVGLACHLATLRLNAPEGTFVYLPPEVLMGTSPPADAAAAGTAAQAGDCYAFGVVLWELVTGELPVRARMRGIEVGVECCDAAAALIEACLSRDVTARPTAAQLVAALEALQGSPDPSPQLPVAAASSAA